MPKLPEADIDYADCAQGTPHPWCDRYEACSRPDPDPRAFARARAIA
jgi:hypothetical protein